MLGTISKISIVVGGLLVLTAPALAQPTFGKNVAPALVKSLNNTQNLRKHPSQYTSLDFRVRQTNFQGRQRFFRAPKHDKAGMKAYVFGVRTVTPHIKRFYSDNTHEVVATAERRVVGVALVGKKGGPAIIDASNLRVRRLDHISLRPLFPSLK